MITGTDRDKALLWIMEVLYKVCRPVGMIRERKKLDLFNKGFDLIEHLQEQQPQENTDAENTTQQHR